MKGWTLRDRALSWANLTALFVLGLGIAVLANFNVERFPKRIDMTEAKAYSLDEQTRALIEHRVNRRLEIYVVGVPFTQDESVFTAMDLLQRLLGEFKRLNPKHIEVTAVAPKGDEDLRQRIEAAVGERLAEGHVYLVTWRRVSSEGIPEEPVVEKHALTDLYLGDPMTGRVLEFRGESALANSIHKMFMDRPRVVYVTRGHGEISRVQGQGDSFHMTAQVFEQRLNIEWRDLDAPIAGVPSDADVVLIPRPLGDFLESELRAIHAYVEGGGHLLVAAVRGSSLTESLRDIDIEVTGSWLLTDAGNRVTIPIQMMGHESNGLKSMEGRPSTAWIQMTEVRPVPREKKKRPLFDVVGTIQTYYPAKPFDFDTVYAVPNLPAIPYGSGPGERLPVAVAGEGPVVQGAPDARVMVWGSAFPLFEGFRDPYLFQLVMNTLNWLWGSEELISAPPIHSAQKPLFLEEEQSTRIFLIVCVAMPIVATLFGIGLWIVRRR